MREWLARIIDRFRRDRLDAELAEELRFHQAQLERDERAAGTPADDAAWAARRQFGNVARIREDVRERWSLPWLDHLQQDMRYAIRGLRRSPGFTLGVVLTLGLGIGANAAIFSVVDRLLFRPPPLLREAALTHRTYFSYPLPDESGERFTLDAVAYARYVDLATWTTSFERTAAYWTERLAVGVGEDAREMPVSGVSAGFFDFFDAPPALGRYFSGREDVPPSGTPVVVLSYGMWQTRYGGRRDALGATLRIGPTMYTVIGVAPRGFVGLRPEQPPVAFIPFSALAATVWNATRGETWWTSKTWNVASVLVKRKPGVTITAASSDLTGALLRSWDARGGAPNLRPNAVAASILSERGPTRTSAAKVAALVGGMALIVLAVAGANVANLLLARALRRRREIVVRLTIGVSRGRLLSQLLTESVLLALLGGFAGLVIAQWGGSVLRAAFLAAGAESPVITDTRTLIFVGVAVLVGGVVTGLAPVWQAGRVELTRYLKAGAHQGTRDTSRVRVTLLVVQAALSVLLLVGAGLFVRSLRNAKAVHLGYDVAPVLVVDLNMRSVRLDSTRVVALRNRLLAAAKRVPRVEHAALNLSLPLAGRRWAEFRVPGIDPVALRRFPDFYYTSVTPEYFATMGTRIVRGRGIAPEDVAGAPGAVVVSSAMARTLWPGQDALGRCLIFDSKTEQCAYVVGIAEDIKNTGLTNDPGLYYYRSVAQAQAREMGLVVRTRGDAADQAESLRQVLQEEMPGGAYATVTPFADIVGGEMHSWQLGATMFAVYGLLALVLAAVGLYGVIAYDVAQRSREMGIRIALGARPGDVVWLGVRQGVMLGALGILIGGAVTLTAAGQLAPLLLDVSPWDPAVYALAAGAMLAVAVAASFIPARRAAGVDPNVALRSE